MRKEFDSIYFFNRWKMRFPPSDWTIIGVSVWWSGPEFYQYRICFFGFEIRIGIKRIFDK